MTEESSCIRIISHGLYNIKEPHFKTPDNIRLIQYSTPGQPLIYIEAREILAQKCDTYLDKFYIIDNKDGKIYKTNFKKFSIEPNSTNQNLILEFKEDDVIENKILLPDDTEYYYKKDIITLKDLLYDLSKYIKIYYPELEIINVIQLSCRSSDEGLDKYGFKDDKDLTELSRLLESISIFEEYNIKSFPGHGDYQVVYTKEEADKLSKEIKGEEEKKERGVKLDKKIKTKTRAKQNEERIKAERKKIQKLKRRTRMNK